MVIQGLTILGKEVTVECSFSDFLSMIDVLDKAEKHTQPEKPHVECPKEEQDEKKERTISAIKAAVESRKQKGYTDEDIVRMHDVEGLEMKEISQITGIPYSTAWQRYHKVVK